MTDLETDMTLLMPITRTAPALPEHDARALTSGGQLANIVLDGQVYTLRITKAGKLILTK